MDLPDVTVSTLGGDVAVDIFNTVSWRLDPSRRRDALHTYLHVVAWMERARLLSREDAEALGHLASQHDEIADAELNRVRSLRDDTYEALTGDLDPELLRRELRDALDASELVRNRDGRWRWRPLRTELAMPRHVLALELERLLTSSDIVNFHRCEDEHCGWVFLDTSRHRNRRWCSSADCGNRNRVRAHYQRTKNARPAPGVNSARGAR